MSCKILREAASEPIAWKPGGSGPVVRQEAFQQQKKSDPLAEALDTKLRQIESDAARAVEEARCQGFAEGERSGAARGEQMAQQARQSADLATERLGRTLEELAHLRRRLRSEAEHDVVRLSIAIARRILHREIEVDREALGGVVKAAIERLDLRETHRIRVNPNDVAPLRQQLERCGMPPRLEVAGDPSLPPGSAIFETSRGTLDASIATQLKEIERGFVDRLHPAE